MAEILKAYPDLVEDDVREALSLPETPSAREETSDGVTRGAVTFTWTTRRRSCNSTTHTNNTRNVAVGTVKKSTEAHWET